MSQQQIYDLIIIGAGPAGLTAGLYAGRFRLKTLILEKLIPGGQIILTNNIENFPGFINILPQELIERIKKQTETVEVDIEIEEAKEIDSLIDAQNLIYKIKTQNKDYLAKSIIVATGARARTLGIKGEERLNGRGVSYCATCDAPLFKDKRVVVIGGGDRALEEAVFLSSYAKKVFLIHRRQEFRAAEILVEKAKEAKINFILETVVEEILGKDKVEAVKIKNLKTSLVKEIPCEGVFIFAGIVPNTDFLKNQLLQDESGFIITKEDMSTSREAIFAAGDCRKKSLYQLITACSEGAIAADSVHKYLLKR